jgi:predicted RNase H-like nuclease (RuvC/YqgF family)
MSFEYEGVVLTPDYKAKERMHLRKIMEQDATINALKSKVADLHEQLREKYREIDNLMIILKAAKKKTRQRKIWKTKEAQGI